MKLVRLEVLKCQACGALAQAVGGAAKEDATFLLSGPHACHNLPVRWETLLSEAHPLAYVASRAFDKGSRGDVRRGVTQPRGRKRVGVAAIGGKK